MLLPCLVIVLLAGTTANQETDIKRLHAQKGNQGFFFIEFYFAKMSKCKSQSKIVGFGVKSFEGYL